MTKLKITGITGFNRGKVRDNYEIGEDHFVMFASDRISAFDVVLPQPIAFKGQVLNMIAAEMLKATRDICPNWLIATPTQNVSIGYKCEPFAIEMVVRGHLAGQAWRLYEKGERMICGVHMPNEMQENEPFPHYLVTPTTKATSGHDINISREDIIDQGLATEEEYEIMEYYSLKLFKRGQKIANERGLILVDTKYEFGKRNGQIMLIDEVHTPDSSRYFYKDGFEQKLERGENPEQLSKEFVRQWLMEKGFSGQPGQVPPIMPDSFLITVSDKYIELYEIITGKKFVPEWCTKEETEEAIKEAFSILVAA